MDTNEQLRDATDALTREVHALSERLSAKELLYQRTRRLTRMNLALVVLVGVGTIIAVGALIRVNSVNDYWSGCFARWGAASSERQDVLNKAAQRLAEKEGAADRAMRILVDYRGDPNNAATDQAKADYGRADDEKIAAQRELQFLREQYPPPQIENFCTRMKDDADPKGRGD